MTPSPEDRAKALVAAMSVDEKVSVALGEFDVVAHLGVPPLVYADGPNGIRGPENVTAFPAALALAATFDEDLATAYGTAVAEEARDTGANVWLGPAADIARAPLGGRLPEALGEDPHLAGRIAAAEVRGAQQRHVVSMLKHVIANNFETGRTGHATAQGRTDAVNVVVGERALHELYLAPFKSALQDGGAGSVMGSYNRVNGTYACQHAGVWRVLKEEWGWQGFVAPDFLFAVREPVAAANAGLDIPGLGLPEGRTREDFTSGRIPTDRLDEIVERVLWAAFSVGLDAHPLAAPEDRPALASTPEHVELATRIAAEGTVLLRNSDDLLPLSADSVRSIAVLGTAREDAQWVMAGSPCVRMQPERRTTPLDGIAARAGHGVEVRFAQGSFGDVELPAVPTEVLATPDGSGRGLLGEYWNGHEPDGDPVLRRVDADVQLRKPPEGVDGALWCARWTGTLTPEVDGRHRFTVLPYGIVSLRIDGQLVAAGAREFGQEFGGPALPVSGEVGLRAGVPVDIELDYSSAIAWVMEGLGGGLRLGWQPPDGSIDEAARLAGDSDVAVVVVGQAQGEGMDRGSLRLPGDQDALVSAVAAANPRTVVVVNTSGPVLMPWLDEVAAVLHVWHPGQQFGEALAAVLFGDAEPGGRLPLTFPLTPEQGPVTRVEQYPGVDGDAHYDEGIFVGYRWYDEHGQEPLFPFGHGLSTTTWSYADSRVEIDEGTQTVTVTVEVTNAGTRSGSDVTQLYVSLADAAAAPPRQLRGFAKVRLDPGASESVRLSIGRDDLVAYDEVSGRWILHDGRYELLVGRSSRDLRPAIGIDVRDGAIVGSAPLEHAGASGPIREDEA